MSTTTKKTGKSALPRIKVTAEDHARLYGLASASIDRIPEVAGRLLDELDRAQIVRPGAKDAGFARMGSCVEYRDESTGKVQAVRLVYPVEADIAAGRISILTPIGAALIGLSRDQSIGWETRIGEAKRLPVLDVREPEFA